jgi:hypothetical protein
MRYVVAAFVVSVALCLGMGFLAESRLEERQKQVAVRRADLGRVAGLDREVQSYQTSKDELERRIDLINEVKRKWSRPSLALQAITRLGDGAALVESVAITDRLVAAPAASDNALQRTIDRGPVPQAHELTLVINGKASSIEELQRFAGMMQGKVVELKSRSGCEGQCVLFVLRLVIREDG